MVVVPGIHRDVHSQLCHSPVYIPLSFPFSDKKPATTGKAAPVLSRGRAARVGSSDLRPSAVAGLCEDRPVQVWTGTSRENSKKAEQGRHIYFVPQKGRLFSHCQHLIWGLPGLSPD